MMANQTPVATLSEDKTIIYLRLPYQMNDIPRYIKGSMWDPYNKAWTVPNCEDSLDIVKTITGIRLPAELLDEYDRGIMWKEIGAKPISRMPLKAGIVPFAHQVVGYNNALEHFERMRCPAGYAYLFEQGCGKTLVGIAVMGRLMQEGKVHRVIIAAPVSVLPVWPKEIITYLEFGVTIVTLSGTKAKKLKSIAEAKKKGGIIVVNYETAWRDGIDDALIDFNPDMIINDESQRIKTPGSKQSKFMHKLGKKAMYKLILTGTPVMNSPLDIWSQYQFLQPGILDSSYWAFKTRHAISGGFEGRQTVAYRGLRELKEKIHSIALRVTKESALDLPEETTQKMYCELEPTAARLYKELKNNFAAELGTKTIVGDQMITRLLRFSQITGGYVTATDDDEIRTVEQVSKTKLRLLDETLTDLLAVNGKKIVIFARFRAEIKAIQGLAGALVGAENVRLIWGDTPQEDRGTFVEDFQTNDDVRVFIAQIQTAGLGITLTAADTAIFYSLDYSYGNHAQAKARVHRIGQRNAVTYIYLLASGTIDEVVFEALENKRSMAEGIIDNIEKVLK